LLLECKVRENRLRVEAFYDDDTPAQQAKIVVKNDRKEIVAEGFTDERGNWSCDAPSAGEYSIRAESVGHVHQETIRIKATPGVDQEDYAVGHAWVTSELTATREQQTATPWLKLAFGLGIIAGVGALVWFARRITREPSSGGGNTLIE